MDAETTKKIDRLLELHKESLHNLALGSFPCSSDTTSDEIKDVCRKIRKETDLILSVLTDGTDYMDKKAKKPFQAIWDEATKAMQAVTVDVTDKVYGTVWITVTPERGSFPDWLKQEGYAKNLAFSDLLGIYVYHVSPENIAFKLARAQAMVKVFRSHAEVLGNVRFICQSKIN